ncbi:1420_t:CDS:2 [Funneliformis caledonium]|uniref:1420_t:CDS:1 n=1 Tax=Funneliformis caledonium TaxID=1117310 RepID=A0A9N9NC94_9GLOM|nr:1420_t:CDS:2 [Funneliformis caledonium]
MRSPPLVRYGTNPQMKKHQYRIYALKLSLALHNSVDNNINLRVVSLLSDFEENDFRAASLQRGYATDWVPYEDAQKIVEKQKENWAYTVYNLLEAILTFPVKLLFIEC